MFDLKQYKSLLSDLKSEGLIPSLNWNEETNANTLFLRHDIDFSIEFAHTLASLEFNLGICSTYFLMLTSNMYNLISLKNQRLAKEIAEMGHKISIHFDPTVYSELSKFEYEKHLFESIFNVEVDIVSIHRPGPFLDNNNVFLCGIPQTYNDTFFKAMKYISDSGGQDCRPQIIEYLSGPRSQGLQLLIHPIWWVGQGSNVTETLNSWRKKQLDFVTSEIRLNVKKYMD